MKKLTNDKQSSFVLTMQRYELFSAWANLFSESAVLFSEKADSMAKGIPMDGFGRVFRTKIADSLRKK